MTQLNRSTGRWMAPAPRTASREVRLWLGRSELWSRVGVCLVAALIAGIVAQAWAPAFPFRVRQHLQRSLNARVEFEIRDVEATRQAREAARGKILCFYENDSRMLPELRQAVVDAAFAVLQEHSSPAEAQTVWSSFWPAGDEVSGVPASGGNAAAPNAAAQGAAAQGAVGQSGAGQSAAGQSVAGQSVEPKDELGAAVGPDSDPLERFRKALAGDAKLEAVRAALDKAFVDIDQRGLLETLEHELGQGSMSEVRVYQRGDLQTARLVQVSTVRIAEIAEELRGRIRSEIQRESERISDSEFVSERLFYWLRSHLPKTLTLDAVASRAAADVAARETTDRMKRFLVGERLLKTSSETGEDALVGGTQPLSESDIRLLQAEHLAITQQLGWGQRMVYCLIFLGLFLTTYGLMAGYLWHRDRKLLTGFGSFAPIAIVFGLLVAVMWLLSLDLRSRLEIIPLVMVAMTIAIAFHVELAVVFATLAALVFTLAHGYDLAEFVILASAGSTAAMFCRSIRSRTKTVHVGLIAAAIVFPISVGSEFLLGPEFTWDMVLDGLWYSGGAAVAGLLITALLPFMERWLGISTDISLLELSDPNHPLLRQLVQRAPGTYNHSINVAAIAEAAAESIGANGLLCRVGAYFHDIGKMRKPEYFVENQVGGENRHNDLVPTMSTLVIISHVRDGVEMARQHHLPERIVDLIEQHHGTTLVEYFYLRAAGQADQEQGLSDSDFRYPGPRPQSPEAAVLMLSDSIEGATRSLREPAPSRIENLVHSITRKKLDDGQFDECFLSLQQIRLIESSLIKSLNAMYHARVKYPEQSPA